MPSQPRSAPRRNPRGRRSTGRAAPRPLGTRNATVIAVAAQKGGVGKTTTSVNLAAAMARLHGKRTLVIDLDPQGHVEAALQDEVHAGGGSLATLLTDEHADMEILDIVARTAVPDLHVTPYDPHLSAAESLLTMRIGREYILREALTATRSFYDVIIIDCPPNLGNFTINALVAADQVLIPCEPTPLALNGVHALVDSVNAVTVRLNPDLHLMGILMTRVDGRNKTLNAAMQAQLDEAYGSAVLPVQIGVNNAISKAQHAGSDIFAFDPSCRGAQQYQALSEYVLDLL